MQRLLASVLRPFVHLPIRGRSFRGRHFALTLLTLFLLSLLLLPLLVLGCFGKDARSGRHLIRADDQIELVARPVIGSSHGHGGVASRVVAGEAGARELRLASYVRSAELSVGRAEDAWREGDGGDDLGSERVGVLAEVADGAGEVGLGGLNDHRGRDLFHC